jgi:hypothetical protein
MSRLDTREPRLTFGDMLVYVYAAALYCEECGEKIREDLTAKGEAPEDSEDETSYDSDDFPKGPTDEGESDSPSHCDGCACFLESTLTSEGEAYVIEAVKSARAKGAAPFTPLASMPVSEQYGGPGQYSRPSEEWAAFYDYLDFGSDPTDDDDVDPGVEGEDDEAGDIEGTGDEA